MISNLLLVILLSSNTDTSKLKIKIIPKYNPQAVEEVRPVISVRESKKSETNDRAKNKFGEKEKIQQRIKNNKNNLDSK